MKTLLDVVVQVEDTLPPEVLEEISRQQSQAQSVPPYLFIIGGLLCLVFGLFMVLAPDEVWTLRHWHSVQGGEPTRFFRICTRIGGALFLAMAVVCAVCLFL